MKKNRLSIPLALTAALAGLLACVFSCAKKHNAPQTTTPQTNRLQTAAPPAPPPAPSPTNSVTENTASAAATNNPAPAETNTVAANVPLVAQAITNVPPAQITPPETNPPGHSTVIEMPTNPPVAPANFYPASMTTNGPDLTPIGDSGCTNFFVTIRAGYEHIYHGDNNDSYWAGLKLYAYGDALRDSAGKNGWLIPDADAEITSGDIAKPDDDPHPGSDSGLTFRADFTWPWFHWTACASGNPDSICPYCRPLALSLGPTLNLGFDHLYDETPYRFASYAGVRLTFNRDGFIEYTAGRTEGLNSVRQQIVAELPLYVSRDGQVHYYLRGLWNHGLSSKPDVLEGGFFVELPLTLLVSPEKWGDLLPFTQ